jgi:hypothetical protein
MREKLKNGYILASIIVIVLMSWLYKPSPYIPPVQPPEVIIKRDTVTKYLQPDKIFIERKVVVHDTVYFAQSGESIETGVARFDSTFDSGAELGVSYYLSPSIFEIDFTEAPIEIKTITNNVASTVYVDSSAWWDRAWIGAGGTLALIKLLQGIL